MEKCGGVEGGLCVCSGVKRWVGINKKDKMCMVTYMEPCHAVLGLLGYKHHHEPLPLFFGGGSTTRRGGDNQCARLGSFNNRHTEQLGIVNKYTEHTAD